jgi:hypothetical protein
MTADIADDNMTDEADGEKTLGKKGMRDTRSLQAFPPGSGYGGTIPPIHQRWKPGQSGNPKGRPNFGNSWLEWVHTMSAYSDEELQAVADDRLAPVLKRGAAMDLQAYRDRDRHIAGSAIDRLLDRTLGKPSQHTTSENATISAVVPVTPNSAEVMKLISHFGAMGVKLQAAREAAARAQLGESVNNSVPPNLAGQNSEPAKGSQEVVTTQDKAPEAITGDDAKPETHK